jgi:hypothetical protein
MPIKVNIALFIANVVGALAYVYVSSHGWEIAREHGLQATTTGEPFVWALYVLPIWALFGSLDLIWGAAIAIRRQWHSGRLWLSAAFIWLIAAAIDFTHH